MGHAIACQSANQISLGVEPHRGNNQFVTSLAVPTYEVLRFRLVFCKLHGRTGILLQDD